MPREGTSYSLYSFVLISGLYSFSQGRHTPAALGAGGDPHRVAVPLHNPHCSATVPGTVPGYPGTLYRVQ